MTAAGLVGCGSFGRHHFRILKELDPPFIGFFDVDRDKGRALQEEHGIRYFEHLPDLLSECEAVVIATPTVHHYETGIKALEAGCHILVEKPITETVQQAEKLVDMAREKQKVLAVGHVERHNPAVVNILSGVTDPRYVTVERLSTFTLRSLDIDVIMDLMIHDLQIVLELAGNFPDEIHSIGLPVLSQKVDLANVYLRFPGGMVANITASRVSDLRTRKLRIFSGQAYYSVDYAEQAVKGYRLTRTDDSPVIVEDTPEVEKGEPLLNEVRDFLGACKSGSRPVVDGPRALEALKLAALIQEGMR